MQHTIKFFIFTLACLYLNLDATPLDDYVKEVDHHYQWTLDQKVSHAEADIFYLNLTSQKWRSAQEVDKPLWQHQLTIVVPKQLKSQIAILTIGNGIAGIPNSYSSGLSPLELALANHAVACELSLVPNQYLKFADEKDPRHKELGRREDGLVAYTWDKYLQTKDPTWPLRLPMTKAVVRGMDATEEFLAQQFKSLKLEGFILIGASKRGWTAWTTAAVDQRVKAIVPLVIDLLNLKQSFKRHYAAYGKWSPAIQDYVDMHMQEKWESANFDELMQMIEPASYLNRFSMPKYIINATGDEFFLPDSSNLYFKSLPGEKLLLYLPNTGHYLAPDLYKDSLMAFISLILNKEPLPTATWAMQAEKILAVKPSIKPLEVNLWQAHNPQGRDFRIHTIGKSWKSTPLTMQADGTFQATLSLPEKGWSAYYIEIKFSTPSGHLLKISTDVTVVPELFPYTYKPQP